MSIGTHGTVQAPVPTQELADVVDEICALLPVPAAELDRSITGPDRMRILGAVRMLNDSAAGGDPRAFYLQQLLLYRIYALITQLPDGPTAEGSVLLHEVTRLLESATTDEQERRLEPGVLDRAPAEPRAYLSWLKHAARHHRVFKHPYYYDFIRNHATIDDLRRYMIQESAVDARFDDLLAMMQVGTSGPAKMEIAANFWDEMGNGRAEEVHTSLFGKIFEAFAVTAEDLGQALTANALLSGNLAVLLCRYRQYYPEAVGFLGMTEWLVPDRFVNVVQGWERLGLPDVGIFYHRLHITIDSKHASGWFHNVVLPVACDERMRRGIARGTLWRLDSSDRYLDERLGEVSSRWQPAVG